VEAGKDWGGQFVVVLGEQLSRFGKQHRENQFGSYDYNRPKPIPPTRVLVYARCEGTPMGHSDTWVEFPIVLPESRARGLDARRAVSREKYRRFATAAGPSVTQSKFYARRKLWERGCRSGTSASIALKSSACTKRCASLE
jgi:hypothetical protein